jgi:hypothetical protein
VIPSLTTEEIKFSDKRVGFLSVDAGLNAAEFSGMLILGYLLDDFLRCGSAAASTK